MKLTGTTALRKKIRDLGSVLIAFSGGVDSTFLLKVAYEVLGDNAVAVSATSPTFPRWECDQAKKFATDLGVRHLSISSHELDLPGYRDNPPDRCYYCKKELFSRIRKIACYLNLKAVCDGTNVDDYNDFRPGRQAAEELGIISPLAQCGFSKDEIRLESRKLGLSTWDKPSFACLASRFPYGEKITAERLRQIEQAETVIHHYIRGQCRVRFHGTIAKIEVSPATFNTIIEHSEQIIRELKACGFNYVTLDLEGYRTGSLNEVLGIAEIAIEPATRESREC